MPAPARIVQPRYYEAFRCIGADCEDTCCDGWGITVDRLTYDKYQHCRDPDLSSSLHELVTINPAGDDDYASIKLSETHCPFLSEGLCSIQTKLGEDYLSNTCATYPRMMNRVGDVLERTLDLSCPEAARIVLLDQWPFEFIEIGETDSFRMGTPYVPDTPTAAYDGRTYPHFREVRSLIVTILQGRAYPLWKRLVITGHFCDKLSEMAIMSNDEDIPGLIQRYSHALNNGSFDELLSKCQFQPAVQLMTVLELVVSRITSDFTGRRFLDCYQEFMRGLDWTQESALSEVAQRYAEALVQYYAPFVNQNQFLMERYLVTYAYKNLFPLGRLESNRKCGLHHIGNSISIQCMLMLAYYAIARTVMIGMAAVHKSSFGVEQALRLIQSSTKAFQHSTSFPLRVIEILNHNGLRTGASMAALVQDVSVTSV